MRHTLTSRRAISLTRNVGIWELSASGSSYRWPQPGNDRLGVGHCHIVLGMVCPQMAGDRLRLHGLIELPRLRKPSVNVCTGEAASACITAVIRVEIKASGQEHSDRHVRDHLTRDDLPQQRFQTVCGFYRVDD